MASYNDAPKQPNTQDSGQMLSTSPSSETPSQPQAVRFASVNQEIEPAHILQPLSTLPSGQTILNTDLSPEAQDEIRNLSIGLHNSHLQQRRMSNFAFEPLSLPASRAPSNDSSTQNASREATRSGGASPRPYPSPSSTPTPPLAPLSSHLRGAQRDPIDGSGAELAKAHPDSAPQVYGTRNTPTPTAMEAAMDQSMVSSAATSRPSSISDQLSTRPTSLSQESSGAEPAPKHVPAFSVGPSETSLSTFEGKPGIATPQTAHDRPFTPVGEVDDPYARSKRPPPTKNLDAIDPRFVFGGKDSRRRSGLAASGGSSASLPPRSNSSNDLKAHNDHKSTFSLHSLGGKKDHFGHLHDDSSFTQAGKPHGSMSELKRFFGIGSKSKRSQSPSSSAKSSLQNSGTRTPPHQLPPSTVPFADDHGLQTRYGKFGKVLGSGAGGSVRLMKRSSDSVTFAVKQFRDRHSYESEREYAKKVTAEFCIGSTLHHGNIIETLDIVHEKGHWYEVMEFAPYDLFAVVMTGKMSREEISCSFLQIVAGVKFLHGMGLAHRDLKLDNVVVNEHGIMKIIDFGSASVFRYPFENDIVLATGIVGSDPYLAPEVYETNKYDPQPTDIWSLAIIYACMSLRRFPWKAPRLTDNSYKLFASPPNMVMAPIETVPKGPSNDGSKSALEKKPVMDDTHPGAAPPSEMASRQISDGTNKHHHHHHHHQEKLEGQGQNSTGENASSTGTPSGRTDAPTNKQEVIKGPWRLLRLLPRESRGIIGKMLEIQPSHRATLEDMMRDPWIADTPVCSQHEGGQVIRAPGHEHTLEPGGTAAAASNQK